MRLRKRVNEARSAQFRRAGCLIKRASYLFRRSDVGRRRPFTKGLLKGPQPRSAYERLRR